MPFTTTQFLDLFAAYNQAIWPLQVVAYGLGILAVVAAAWGHGPGERVAVAVLGLFWGWIGIVYHGGYFTAINPAAWLFAALFLAQALLFLYRAFGTRRRRLGLRLDRGLRAATGVFLILYAMVVYPLLGAWAGHSYPRVPTFGVTPCPATIFTLGVLLWATRPVPFHLLIVPLLWSLIGLTAALQLQILQDYGLAVAGLVAGGLLLARRIRARHGTQQPS